MKCPLPESNEDNNVENSVFNYWQNMKETGALNLDTNVYKKNNGFFIKFTSYASNCKCNISSCANENDTFIETIKPKSFMYTISNNIRHLNKQYNETVNVESPVFYYVDLNKVNERNGILQIKVESNDPTCGTVSIHSLDCQTNECFKNSIVHWQTMINLGILTITADKYPDGFFIKFATHQGANYVLRLCLSQ